MLQWQNSSNNGVNHYKGNKKVWNFYTLDLRSEVNQLRQEKERLAKDRKLLKKELGALDDVSWIQPAMQATLEVFFPFVLYTK